MMSKPPAAICSGGFVTKSLSTKATRIVRDSAFEIQEFLFNRIAPLRFLFNQSVKLRNAIAHRIPRKALLLLFHVRTESREHIVPPDTVDGPGDFYGIGTADETDTTVRHDLRKTAHVGHHHRQVELISDLGHAALRGRTIRLHQKNLRRKNSNAPIRPE